MTLDKFRFIHKCSSHLSGAVIVPTAMSDRKFYSHNESFLIRRNKGFITDNFMSQVGSGEIVCDDTLVMVDGELVEPTRHFSVVIATHIDHPVCRINDHPDTFVWTYGDGCIDDDPVAIPHTMLDITGVTEELLRSNGMPQEDIDKCVEELLRVKLVEPII